MAHGTSWGFPTSRIDGGGNSPYLRISVGLESDETVKKLGSIVGQELNEILKKSIVDCQELLPRASLTSPR